MEVPLEEVKSWIRMMDVLLLNEEEAIYLTGETNPEKALELLLDDCETVVIKRGSLGAIGKTRGSILVTVPTRGRAPTIATHRAATFAPASRPCCIFLVVA